MILYILGLLISLSGFIIAIISATKDYKITMDVEADMSEVLYIKNLNSLSIILTCIGFLLIHAGHISKMYQK